MPRGIPYKTEKERNQAILDAQARWQKRNPNYRKNWRKNNKDKIQKWNDNNRGRWKIYNKTWRKNNKDKAKVFVGKRRAMLFNAIPKNQTKKEKKAVNLFYMNKPKNMTVDHIIPLNKGGKHEIKNLQYLTGPENSRKSDKFPYYPLDFYRKRGLIT